MQALGEFHLNKKDCAAFKAALLLAFFSFMRSSGYSVTSSKLTLCLWRKDVKICDSESKKGPSTKTALRFWRFLKTVSRFLRFFPRFLDSFHPVFKNRVTVLAVFKNRCTAFKNRVTVLAVFKNRSTVFKNRVMI